MAEAILRDDTTGLAGLTLQEASEIRASLTKEEKVPEDLVLGFNSEDPHIKKASLIQIRTIIQRPSPPEAVQAVLDTGLVPAIVSLLESEDTRLQIEAAWIVTNLACGTVQQTEQVLDAGAIPKLVILSASPNAEVAENAVWALGNALAQFASLRDRVEEEGGVAALVKLVDRGEPCFEKVQRRVFSAILCYLNPSHELPITRIKHVLPCIAQYIQETPVNEANMASIEYAIEALDRICKHGLQRTDFIATGVVPCLVKLLADPLSSITLQEKVLRCLGYLVSGSDDDRDVALSAGLLNIIGNLPPSEAVQPVINYGVVPAVISLLHSEDTDLQSRASWIITHLASGTDQQTEQVINAGAIPGLIILSASPKAHIASNAVLALGNILGNCASLRDYAEEKGGVAALVQLMDRREPSFERVQGKALWAISRYLDPWSSRKPPIKAIKHVLPSLARYIQETPINEANMESIEYAVQALGHGCRHDLRRKDFIAIGVVPHLVKLLADSMSSVALQQHVLNCLGYVISGSDDETDVAVNAGLLPGLLVALETKNGELCRLALWNATNVAARRHSQVCALLDSGLLKPVIRILTDDQESTPCKRNACWTISNLAKEISGDPKVAQALIEGRCVEALSAALLIPDPKAKERAVVGITRVLEWKPPQGSEADKSPLTIL